MNIQLSFIFADSNIRGYFRHDLCNRLLCTLSLISRLLKTPTNHLAFLNTLLFSFCHVLALSRLEETATPNVLNTLIKVQEASKFVSGTSMSMCILKSSILGSS